MMNIAPPETKSDFAYRQIRAAIVEGRLQPSQRLRLGELAAQFGISEMPIREALRMLQRDGLIEFASHRGAVVVDISLQELVDIISVRTYLEILAACEATPHHTERSLKELDKLVAKMLTERGNQQFSQLNHEFHELLIKPCPNAFLRNEIKALWDRVWKRWSRSLFELFPSRMEDAAQEHERIVAAVRSGSVEAVRRTVEAHRARTVEQWTRLL